MGVLRVALGGDILGSRRNPRRITTTITTEAPAPATTRPTLHQQLNLQLQLQLQLQRRTTVHWPTGVHQEGVYTRWNGYCLMRGLVGQDKSYFMLARARRRILARARARLRLRALARACARAFAPTVAGACRDMTSLGPSSFRDHVVGVITQSPSQQMPSWWQLYFSFLIYLCLLLVVVSSCVL